jgi:hypothetical protein
MFIGTIVPCPKAPAGSEHQILSTKVLEATAGGGVKISEAMKACCELPTQPDGLVLRKRQTFFLKSPYGQRKRWALHALQCEAREVHVAAS